VDAGAKSGKPVLAQTVRPPGNPATKPVAPTPASAGPSGPAASKANRWPRRWLWLASAIAGGSALVWFFGVPLLFGPVIMASPVVRADLVQTLVASGHIETPFRVSISSQITGVAAVIAVDEGQHVKTGDVLIRLDDGEARATMVQAEGQVAQAEARLRQVRDLTLPSAERGLDEARATLVNVQQIYTRASRLLADGVGTRAAFDEATKNLDIARAQVRNAELTVFSNRPGGSDFTVAETQASQAQATLNAARSRLGYTVIRAARDGVLIWRDVEVGNVVQPGKELMRLSPDGDMQIAIQVDEKNLGLIALKQEALVSADAFSKQTFPATVTFINPAVDLQRASVEAKLRVAAPPAYLRQDMTVSVDIEVARRAGAIIVPVADIHDLASGKPWLLTARNGHARRQDITVGLVSAGKAEVLTGVEEGAIVLPLASKAEDGQRIRLHAPAAPLP
jgi:HlyD family secretion protein